MKWQWYKGVKEHYKNTGSGLYIAATIMIGLHTGGFVSGIVKGEWLGFFMGALLGGLLTQLVVAVASCFLGFFLKRGAKAFTYILIGSLLMGYSCENGSIGVADRISIVVALLAFAVILLFGASAWAFFENKVYAKPILFTMMASGTLTVAFLFFLFGEGFLDTYIRQYRQADNVIAQEAAQQIDGFMEYTKTGSYEVESLEYSPYKEVELTSETVDLSKYVMDEKKWRKIYRSFFFDYGLEEAPLAGKVWYPKEDGNYPVIFMVHGNHSITEESYLGYEYLGTYLASHGYVFVSVDENILNERSGENDARAVLLLENIKLLQRFNRQEDNPLFQKMDYDNIALAGHSRGGETIAAAYLFNDYDTYPSNGMFEFSYHFHIKALLAIAPSVNQYLPAGHETELMDVDYLVIQGANDQDISVFLGNEQYENVSFSGEEAHQKSSLYIAAANHGQFNTLWGSYDLEPPFSWWLNVKNFMEPTEQQKILQMFAQVFFDQTLKGEDTYADLLTDYRKYEKALPKTVYVQQYAKAKDRYISDFEEDSDLETTTDGSSVAAEHLSMWTEEDLSYSNTEMGKRENHALRLKWKNTTEACYDIQLAKITSLEQSAVVFDACNLSEEAAGTLLDFTVELRDWEGRTVQAKVSDVAALYPAFPVKLSKIQYLLMSSEKKHQFQTVTLPITCFAGDALFDAEHVAELNFLFDQRKSGALNLDHIGIAGE